MNQKTHSLRYIPAFKMVLALTMAGMLVVSCEKKQEEKNIEEIEKEQVKQATDERAEIIRMPDIKENKSEKYNNHVYDYSIVRTACDSLGIVTDSDGFRTVDNTIQLYVKRDGVLILNKTFTRRSFKIGISDEEFSHYVLSNMSFNRMTPSGIQFDVTLSEGSVDDICIPFSLTVGPDGTINIAPREAFQDEDINRFEDVD